ncbi:hypothetical protein EYF80_001543 [Liparis tanakae]|uniref:Uncharacterized protein n=1 Tax=Liparis tanakae TaxID=230148 RepID=A0A4Z2JEC7_9TELE|nr:hypothetical protein EYF80_001543 [Liparis tanakae]
MKGQESLKNVERFPGDTNEKLSEMWGGIELKGQLLREIPPVAFGAIDKESLANDSSPVSGKSSAWLTSADSKRQLLKVKRDRKSSKDCCVWKGDRLLVRSQWITMSPPICSGWQEGTGPRHITCQPGFGLPPDPVIITLTCWEQKAARMQLLQPRSWRTKKQIQFSENNEDDGNLQARFFIFISRAALTFKALAVEEGRPIRYLIHPGPVYFDSTTAARVPLSKTPPPPPNPSPQNKLHNSGLSGDTRRRRAFPRLTDAFHPPRRFTAASTCREELIGVASFSDASKGGRDNTVSAPPQISCTRV